MHLQDTHCSSAWKTQQSLGAHSVKIRVDDEVEKEYAAGALTEGEAPVAAVSDAEEDAAKSASKKKEVKLQVVVTRR